MFDATRVVRAGLPHAEPGAPFLPGPTFAAPYHTTANPGDSPYTYGRFHNPTWTHYEAALTELEGGPAIIFASGMAATTAILSTTLKPGQRVVMSGESYYTTRLVTNQFFASLGVHVIMATSPPELADALTGGTTLLWLESPTNPGLNVTDIAAMSRLAHAAGALVVVDNTTATVLGQRPLALGADFSMASDTKAMTGHADVILGHVATRDANWAERLRSWRTQMGSIPGPMEVWLAHRSLGTLDVRLERQCNSALQVAEFLLVHDKVTNVRYPGLASDPSHAIAAKQMSRFGPVIAFTLPDQAACDRFFAASRLVHQATSFGGIHTSAERRARWGGDVVADGFIRLSIGLEDVRDLLHDLNMALAVI